MTDKDSARRLHVIAYHYVRDSARSAFPGVNGVTPGEFSRQLDYLTARFDAVDMEGALAFINGENNPGRDLFMVTFDDGLRDHYETVFPMLQEKGLLGVFSVITSGLSNARVAPVHMSHFLLADLGFKAYQRAFLDHLAAEYPEARTEVDHEAAKRTYQWDDAETGQLKYLINHQLDWGMRDDVLRQVFESRFGGQRDFASTLYCTWDEIREMQRAGMVIAAHSHNHRPLARMGDEEQASDIEICTDHLRRELESQPVWVFSYPHGKPDTFNERTVYLVKRAGYDCALAGTLGANDPSGDQYRIWRHDCNDIQKGRLIC